MTTNVDQEARQRAMAALREEFAAIEQLDPTIKHVCSARFCDGVATALDHLGLITLMAGQGVHLGAVVFEARAVSDGSVLLAAIARVPAPPPAAAGDVPQG
jgi:hypothetical protein